MWWKHNARTVPFGDSHQREAGGSACGLSRAPFAWDEERRFQLGCELGTASFHLYEVRRDGVTHIMEPFPIVKRKDEAQFGMYCTKEDILAVYDPVLPKT